MDLVSALRKERFVLTPDLLLTEDGPQEGQAIVVVGNRIAQVVPRDGLAPADAGIALRLPMQAVIPGFIDAHTHLGQTFGKALIGGEPAQIWRRIWAPLETSLDVEGCYASAKWQFLELLRGGYTGVINYSLNDATRNAAVHRAAAETGIRLVSACGLDEASGEGATRHSLTAILDRAAEHIAQCEASDLVSPSLCCSSFYGNAPETMAALRAFAEAHGVLLQIHANEHFPEVHECTVRYGKRPIELLADSGVLGPNTLLHHTTLASDREIEHLRKAGAAVSYNPVASQWKGNAVAPALAYAERGVRMGLGSDNTRVDGFRTLDAAENAQRISRGMPLADFSCGAGWLWVDTLTRGSADAAGWAGKTGVLAPGMAADLLVLDMNRPETLPSFDFEWELVRYYNRDQIAAVVIDGKPVMAGGRPVGWDDAAFIAQYAALAKAAGSVPAIQRVHGPSGRYRPRRSA